MNSQYAQTLEIKFVHNFRYTKVTNFMENLCAIFWMYNMHELYGKTLCNFSDAEKVTNFMENFCAYCPLTSWMIS